VAVARDLIREEEQRELMVWAEDKHGCGRLLENPHDPGGYLTPYQSVRGVRSSFTQTARDSRNSEQQFVWIPSGDAPVDPLPQVFWTIRDRVIEWLRLSDVEEDYYKGSFLTYTQPGAAVHQHMDAKVVADGEACHVLRCNVLFRRPEGGGNPNIANTALEVPDRGAWAFYATAQVHSASVVEGSYRGTLSFGFLIRPARLWGRRFQIPERVRLQLGLDQEAGRRALMQQMREARSASAIAGDRLALVEFVTARKGPFDANDASAAVGLPPVELFPAILDLQRSGFVESLAGLAVSRGSVVIL
jgi:hypothetical protein